MDGVEYNGRGMAGKCRCKEVKEKVEVYVGVCGGWRWR